MSKRVDDVKEVPTRVKEAAEGAVRALKDQARRPDRVGEVTHRTWVLVHDGVGVAARSLSRLERATQPPARAMGRGATSHRTASSRATADEKTKGDS